jgi:hypothetical protein
MFAGFQRLARVRRRHRALHGDGRCEPVWTGDPHVFGLLREHAGERLLLLASFSAQRRALPLDLLARHGVALDVGAAEADGRTLHTNSDRFVVEPFQHLWVSAPARFA